MSFDVNVPNRATRGGELLGVHSQLLCDALLEAGGGDTAELEARVAANGNDLDARFELAQAYAAGPKRDEAVDQLIAIIAVKRDWNEDAARQELLKFFEAFGPTDPATVEGRKKLSSVWFS